MLNKFFLLQPIKILVQLLFWSTIAIFCFCFFFFFLQGIELSNPQAHANQLGSGTQSTYFSEIGTFSKIKRTWAIKQEYIFLKYGMRLLALRVILINANLCQSTTLRTSHSALIIVFFAFSWMGVFKVEVDFSILLTDVSDYGLINQILISLPVSSCLYWDTD